MGAPHSVIVAAFSAFVRIGVYPAWIVALIGIVFLNFVVTSRFTPRLYDPIGRHIGGVLFLCIAATLLLHDLFFQAIILFVTAGTLASTAFVRLVHTCRVVTRRPRASLT